MTDVPKLVPPDGATIATDIPALPSRDPWMHKGEAGRVFCVAGSVGMVGAATLCSRAALRAGAGLVRVGMPWRLAAVVAGRDPNVMSAALPETEDGTVSAMAAGKILAALEGYDVLLIGPGISTNPQTVQVVRSLLPQVKAKMVIDADALNAIAKEPAEVLEKLPRHQGRAILTPHPGEFRRLLGGAWAEADFQRDETMRRDVAVSFARKYGVTLVLKGYRTVVTDGARIFVNPTGNAGMAKAGMGDVLAGVIAALRGQGMDDFEASVLGVYAHGLAGDRVRDEIGEIGMIATDVIEALPTTMRELQQKPKPGRKSARMRKTETP